MSVHLRQLHSVVLFTLITTACSPSAVVTPTMPATATAGPTRTPTRVPTRTPGPTWTPQPSATTDPCTPAEVIRNLRSFMPYEEAMLYYNDPGGMRVLEVWFVEPLLDASATQAEVDENAAIALSSALLLAFRMNAHVHPCLVQEFREVFAIVVDPEYHAWFSGWIAVDTLAPVSDPTLSQWDAADIEPMYLRREAPPSWAVAQPGSEACPWSQVRRYLAVSGDTRRGVEGAHLFGDDEGVHLWLQREVAGDPSSVLLDLMDIAPDLACLVPRPDWVWMLAVDHRGVVRLFGRVPGEALRSEVYPGAILGQFEVLGP